MEERRYRLGLSNYDQIKILTVMYCNHIVFNHLGHIFNGNVFISYRTHIIFVFNRINRKSMDN